MVNYINDSPLEVYFETYGCTANRNSSEIMKGLVVGSEMNITNNPEIADIMVINSCIVKESTKEKIRIRVFSIMEKIQKEESWKNKKLILAGCMPSVYKENFSEFQNKGLYFLDTSRIKDLLNLIRSIYAENYYEDRYLEKRNEEKLFSSKVPDNKIIGITQISEGCLGNCTYCVTRLAKGKLFSYSPEEILKSVKRDVLSGCKEIWITSQDNSAYGMDFEESGGKSQLPTLLKNILEIPGNFKVRLGMSNPNHILPILDDLIEIYKDKKMFKFLHVPVQSGSNKVLREMNRNYKIEDAYKIINRFKEEIPEIIIASDIIVGFPTESKEDWQKTLDFVKKVKPEILNRSNFTGHKKTPAEELVPLDSNIIKERAKELDLLHRDICSEIQSSFVGKEIEILIDKKGWPGTWLGRTSEYRLAAVQTKDNKKKLLGKKVKAKVKTTTPHYLICSLEE